MSRVAGFSSTEPPLCRESALQSHSASSAVLSASAYPQLNKLEPSHITDETISKTRPHGELGSDGLEVQCGEVWFLGPVAGRPTWPLIAGLDPRGSFPWLPWWVPLCEMQGTVGLA